ncbi:MAG: methyltransferase domain-containing protein [Hyphomonadaceae bacterium]|nr:methyltransferase domain-containing protein [Hyphomonadaceae bacterium]
MLTAKLEHLGLRRGDRVLDLGCGEGRHVHGLYMLGEFEIFGIDLDEPSLDRAREGLATLPVSKSQVTFETGDATALRFEDDFFDAIICSEVLEHLPNYDAALVEMRRILKPSGRLCVSVPHAWPERICWQLAPPPNGYPYQPGGHIRIFDEVDLKTSIERRGFRIIKRHHAHGIHVPYWWLKCAFWERSDDHPWVKTYHDFLVWDLMKKPWITRALDAVLSPVMGKSLVMYFDAKAPR